MKTLKFDNITEVLNKSQETLSEGNEVVFDFGKHANHEHIARILTYFHEDYKLEVNIRHAEFQEILEAALTGAVAGGAIGILAGLILGGPVGTLAMLGAALGLLIGSASVVLQVKVYKYRGNTLVKITPA